MAEFQLSKGDMHKYFMEINRRLAQEGKHGEIFMLGGAALTLVFNAREATRDIDAIFHPAEDMREIIKDIAHEYDLAEDWLNDGAKNFLTPQMKFNSYLSLSNLTISSIDAEGLLALKLTAARADSKDMPDSIFLMSILNIHTEKELFDIIEKYTYPQMHTPKVMFFTKEAFEKYHRK